MRYNDIPNILAHGLVVQNKPLSNLEITDAAKNRSISGFRRGFLRDVSRKTVKKTSAVF